MVVDKLDTVVFVVHRIVSAAGFRERKVVDALEGGGDLCGQLVIVGDQCGDPMPNECAMPLGCGKACGPKLRRTSRGAVGNRIILTDIEAIRPHIAYSVE